MISNDQPKVTIFKNILQTTNGDDFFMSDIIGAIRDGHWKEKIETLRSIENKSDRSDFKKNNLPYFTGSGTFDKRNDKSIREHNGRVILDFDNLPDVARAKSILCADEFVEHCFVSASGQGLAVVVKIDPTKHAESFVALKTYFEQKYLFNIDSLADVSRARFISYDPELFTNIHSKVYLISKNAEQKIKAVIENMINRATDGEKHNTVLRASRLAGGFVSGGIIDETEIFDFIVNTITNAGFRTDVHVQTVKDGIVNGKLSPLQMTDAERMTVESEQDRKNWSEIYSFIHSINRAGRPFGDTDVVHLCEKYLISKDKITNAFNKVFAEHADEFDLDNQPEIARVELFIRQNWEIVRNEVTGISEFRKHGQPEFERMNSNTVFRAVQHAGFKFSEQKLKSLLKSDFVRLFNPFKDYFDSLPSWSDDADHVDHIQKLASFVKVKGDQQFFETQFKKHLVRCLHCTLKGRENRFVFVLIGEKQETGKSTFIRNLNPFGSKYYTETPIRDNKDTEISFAENFIHNLEELSSLGKLEVNHLKSVISRSIIKERKPYGENAEDYPRRVNFFGSTNKDEFLTDTQNTRWLCFEVESINWNYSRDVSITDVWSQAFALFKNGFDCQLTQDESDARDKVNKSFEITDLEKDVLTRYFKQPPSFENQYFKPTSEILESLIKSTDARLKLNHWNLNKALKQLGFVPDRKELNGHRVRGFYCVPNPDNNIRNVADPVNADDLPF